MITPASNFRHEYFDFCREDYSRSGTVVDQVKHQTETKHNQTKPARREPDRGWGEGTELCTYTRALCLSWIPLRRTQGKVDVNKIPELGVSKIDDFVLRTISRSFTMYDLVNKNNSCN